MDLKNTDCALYQISSANLDELNIRSHDDSFYNKSEVKQQPYGGSNIFSSERNENFIELIVADMQLTGKAYRLNENNTSQIGSIEVDDNRHIEVVQYHEVLHDPDQSNSGQVELIEVDDNWLTDECATGPMHADERNSEDAKYPDQSNSGLVELIEVDDNWLTDQCVSGSMHADERRSEDSNHPDQSNSGLVELIEVDDNWLTDQCVSGSMHADERSSEDSNHPDQSNSGQVELIEVDDNWLTDECATGPMLADERNSEDANYPDQSNYGQSEFNEDETDSKIYTCVRINAQTANEHGNGDPGSYIHLKQSDRISELKMSLIETKDNSTLTKKGLVRKRRVFKMPLKERLAGKFQLQQEIHPLRTACQHGDCNKNLPQQRRLEINNEFWQMRFSDRYTFGLQTISRKDIKQRRRNTRAIKNNTFQYFLKDGKGEIKRVCQTFYLTTLGFSKHNDSFIKTVVGNTRYKIPLPRSSKRGSHDRPNRKDYECIVAHIRSYNPNVSHHRREHAPKKIYLPENLTITSMHKHFREENPHVQCSYYLYRRVVTNELNISFTKLGHEQCETCEEYDLHKKCNPTCDSCDLCVEFEFHKKKYTESRALYDDQRLLNTEKKSFYSADLEKVIMLPRLEMFKEVIFSSRLSAYNHTFAPLGGYQNNPQTSKVVAVIWHEAVSGRCKEDITSAFYNFFIHKRTVEEHVLWLDNCSSQNKNWTLFSFLVYMINSMLIEATKIQLNYFEPGHTFMSADSFHFQVEKSLTEMKKVYHFNDFQTAVSNANSGHVTVIPMEAANFMKWQDCSSRPKRTSSLYMHEIVQVTAVRGSFTLKCKKSFSSMEEIDLDFLQKKYKNGEIPAPLTETSVCGIHEERKKSILKLCSIFPADKIEFWQNLAVTKQVTEKASSRSKVSDGSVTQRKKIPRQSRQAENTVTQSNNEKSKRGQCKKNTALVKQASTKNYLATNNQETKKDCPKTRISVGTSSVQNKKNQRRGRQAEEAGNTEKPNRAQCKTNKAMNNRKLGPNQKPTTKEPTTKKPTTKKPTTKKPTTKIPATKIPATKKPATKIPATKKPATKKPATKKPATKKPATKKPSESFK